MIMQAVELKKRSDVHWARKIWHMVGVSTILLLFVFLPEQWSRILITVGWLLFVPFDLIRQNKESVNKFTLGIFAPIMRQSELHKLAGTTYLLSGVALVVYFAPRPIVILTLLFLAFADPLASYFGIRYGKDKILGDKSLQGTLAAFGICFLLSLFFLLSTGILNQRIILVSILSGIIGALAELIPIAKLDDNFTLPVISATFLWILFSIFGAL